MVWSDNSRIISALAVVIIHVSPCFLFLSNTGSQHWWCNIYSSFFRWCVPVFVMISGAFLLAPNKTESMGTFYKKRASKILIPIFFWAVFFALLPQLQGMMNGKELSVIDFLNRLLFIEPLFGHIWFLYMIIPLYLFTPFFRKIIANSTRKELMILIVISFLIAVLNYIYDTLHSNGHSLIIRFFPSFIPFYFLGYLIRTDERHISKNILWCVFLFSSCSTVIGHYILATLNAGSYFYGYLSVTVIPMSVSMMYLLKSWTKPIINEKITSTLSSLTLGVYLIHPLFLGWIQKFGPSIVKLHPAVSIPVTSIIIFSSSLMIVWCVNQLPYLKRVI